MLNKKALAASVSAGPSPFIEDVFSTYLYTGTGAALTITNDIDLDGEGGLTWIKSRSAATDNQLFDTVRGATNELISNSTAAQAADADTLTAFNADGFSLGADSNVNTSAAFYCSWTFRKAPKFFDVVSYTGTGSNTTILHDLGSVPGMIIVKRTDTSGAWQVYHRANTANPETDYLVLNTTAATADSDTRWNDTLPTSTVFSLGTDATVNASGGTYVAYLFAHDAGGFGTAGTDNVISCGSFTTNASGAATINVGYEPQYVLFKCSSFTGAWYILDVMRGFTVDGGSELTANTADVEASGTLYKLNSSGFSISLNLANWQNKDFIYMAIRRPMKVPTTGTEVFQPIAYTSDDTDNRLVNTGIVTDMTMARIRTATSASGFYVADRLRGNASLGTTSAALENIDTDSFMTPTVGYGNSFSAMNGFGVGNDTIRNLNESSASQLAYAFQRRPGFFDVVCYTGTGSARTVAHNLGAVPELMIVKKRSATDDWAVYAGDNTDFLLLNTTAATADNNTYWNDTSPTSSVFSVGTNADVNTSAATYVAYLFATLAGISKVGSYTGNGGTQAIACGFTGGARFVMIKRTDSTGDWYVYDTARGMTLLTDPYLRLNSTAAESATLGSVTTTTGGFTVDASILAAINTNTASYIFLAIA
jgi:hypothetical protein